MALIHGAGLESKGRRASDTSKGFRSDPIDDFDLRLCILRLRPDLRQFGTRSFCRGYAAALRARRRGVSACCLFLLSKSVVRFPRITMMLMSVCCEQCVLRVKINKMICVRIAK